MSNEIVNFTQIREKVVTETVSVLKAYLAKENPASEFPDEVRHLLGGDFFYNNLLDYEEMSLETMKALLQPEVNSAIKNAMLERNYKHLVDLLSQLISFCKIIRDDPRHMALLHLANIEQSINATVSIQEMQQVAGKYNDLIA